MTRVAVPVISSKGLSSMVSEHFARSEDFAIIEAEGSDITSVTVAHIVPEDDKKKAGYLADNGVEVVVAGRIGACMTRILIDRGIKVFSGAEGTVQAAYEAYRSGALTEVRPNLYQL